MKHILLLLTLFIASVSNVNSALVLNWEFDSSINTYSSNQNVFMNARLHNSITSTESFNLGIDGQSILGGSYDGKRLEAFLGLSSITDEYDIYFNYIYDFENLTLAPGQSISFTFMELVSKTGAASSGTYDININEAGLLLGDNGIYDFVYADNAASFIVTSVPAPPAILLFISGIFGFLLKLLKNS